MRGQVFENHFTPCTELNWSEKRVRSDLQQESGSANTKASHFHPFQDGMCTQNSQPKKILARLRLGKFLSFGLVMTIQSLLTESDLDTRHDFLEGNTEFFKEHY